MMNCTGWSPSEIIASLQLLGSIIAGGFALYLFWLTVREKRSIFRINMYDRIYGNPDVAKVFYLVEKMPKIVSLEEKVDRAISGGSYYYAEHEREIDMTLKYLDFIGHSAKKGDIKYIDLQPFEYELRHILEHKSILKYLNYLKSRHQMKVEGLDYLRDMLRGRN